MLIYYKEVYGESPMLSGEWERCPNCPPPCGGVPAKRPLIMNEPFVLSGDGMFIMGLI